MRASAIFVIILLGAPLAGALVATPAPLAPDAVVRDGDVLLLLAARDGLHVERLPIPVARPGMRLPDAVALLAARAGVEVPDEDLREFGEVDPRLEAPLVTMILAMDEAWLLADEAFADVPLEAQRAAFERLLRGEIDHDIVLTASDQELLLQAAILLTDTIEGVVIPQLAAAADLGIWPATAIADPVGLLRIGGTGDDLETLDRLLQVDARGNDLYRNNAGGATTVISTTDPTQTKGRIAVSLDLTGDDDYRCSRPCQGSGEFGLGILYDLRGDDLYDGTILSTGAGAFGIGIVRDAGGNDEYRSAFQGTGYAAGNFGIGYTRDDNGGDHYQPDGSSGGASQGSGGKGFLWDRAGLDEYITSGSGRFWGWASAGEGWFVDEGADQDTHATSQGLGHPLAGNDRTWSTTSPIGGHGNDNSGGLPFLLAKQRRIP